MQENNGNHLLGMDAKCLRVFRIHFDKGFTCNPIASVCSVPHMDAHRSWRRQSAADCPGGYALIFARNVSKRRPILTSLLLESARKILLMLFYTFILLVGFF